MDYIKKSAALNCCPAYIDKHGDVQESSDYERILNIPPENVVDPDKIRKRVRSAYWLTETQKTTILRWIDKAVEETEEEEDE